ncbi:MAG: Mth938-like domain-containing protein, partial [Pseudomonadota bacterium]
TDAGELSLASFDRVFDALRSPSFLLLGTGARQVFPSAELRAAFIERGIGLEPMDTGAACRTYNVLLAEKRPVAAAIIAVE